MTDERDYLERTDSIWQKANGETASLDDLADAFSLYGPEKAHRRARSVRRRAVRGTIWQSAAAS